MDTKNLHRLIMAGLIDSLKNSGPIAYDDHDNLWIDFGWDISEGDGTIAETVKDMLIFEIRSLPEILRQLLWWESFDGRYAKKEIMEALEQGEPVESPDEEEIMNTIAESLFDTLSDQAEIDFDEFVYDEDGYDEDEDEDLGE